MNKLLLLGIAAGLCGSAVCQAAPEVRKVKHHRSEQAAKARKAADNTVDKHDAPWPGSPTTWMPGTVQGFYWGENSNNEPAWISQGINKYEYNEQGQVVRESLSNDQGIETEVTTYEYDARGNVTVQTRSFYNGSELVPDNKMIWAYDEATGVCISEEGYYYNNGAWISTWTSAAIITRDAKGNITKIEESYNGDVQDFYTEFTYGSDGKCTTITEYEDGHITCQLSDIVWEKTNGQIIDTDFEDEDFYMGDNLIKSATWNASDWGPVPQYLTATYPTEGSFAFELKYGGKVVRSIEYTSLDSNGSYTKKEYEIDYDDDDNGNWVEDGDWTYERTRNYDSYGLQLNEATKEWYDGELDDDDVEEATVTYDSTYGYPTEYINKYGRRGEALENSERYLFGDYTNAGVANVAVDDNAPVEYFNLQGIRVENPAAGLYIRRQGNKAIKVRL